MRMKACAIAGTVLIGACAPTLNWREIRPVDSGVLLLLPCKPEHHTRRVQLASAHVALALHACNAGGVTWAIAVADVGDPALVVTALEALRSAAAANLDGATAARTMPLAVNGATPNPSSTRLRLQGKLPDGKSVDEELALFAKGTRVFQATCVGASLPAPAVETFFGSLRVER